MGTGEGSALDTANPIVSQGYWIPWVIPQQGRGRLSLIVKQDSFIGLWEVVDQGERIGWQQQLFPRARRRNHQPDRNSSQLPVQRMG